MESYYEIKIGYNGASGAGGDVASEFKIDHEQAKWFAVTFFKGLRATESHSGFVRIIGKDKSVVLSCANWSEPDYENLKLPEPY